jgi:UDP-N-acetylmuramate--alanine ligase
VQEGREYFLLSKIHNIHFVGIGGSGMSGIAKVLLETGYNVSGSDLSKSETTHKLEKIGAKVFLGHDSANIVDAEAIVVSTAIPESNPELQAARERGLMVFHRADIVAQLMEKSRGIAVAGAHGKTTTTSMIAVMLEQAGKDPTVIVGGELDYLKGNAKLGQGPYLVAEADESDGSFLKYSPEIAIVTNIENDHMDYYGTMEKVLQTFEAFLQKLSEESGVAILCFDNGYIREMAPAINRRYISYALEHEAEYTVRNIHAQGAMTLFDVYRHNEFLGTIKLNVPGRHNVSNSLAAVITGLTVGLPFKQIADGLAKFYGAKRRFQTKAKVNGAWIVDDYAHHPTEIISTLQAARQTAPKRLICVFQPHRFSRTQLLQKEFGGAFSASDILVLTDIYSAGEQPISGISGAVIRDEVERQTDMQVIYIPEKDKIARYLAQVIEPGDLVMTMGAGNIYQVGEELIEILIQKQ